MRNVAWALVAVASLTSAFVACATATPPDDGTSGDGGGSDAAAGSDANGNCPTGKSGPKCDQCAGGFHKCAADCRPDQPNSPDAGCTQGCGAPCAPPAHASGKCTSAGQCDFACDSTFVPAGGGDGGAGCECPAGQILCGDVCAQCCSTSDCPGHQLCNGGVCGGCQPNWGDCNNNPGDGCESNLSQEPNCGTCGTSCCGYPCCGVVTFHGKSCQASGNGYACGC